MEESRAVLLSFGRGADFSRTTLKALESAPPEKVDAIMAEAFYQASQTNYRESFALIADRAIAKVLEIPDLFR